MLRQICSKQDSPEKFRLVLLVLLLEVDLLIHWSLERFQKSAYWRYLFGVKIFEIWIVCKKKRPTVIGGALGKFSSGKPNYRMTLMSPFCFLAFFRVRVALVYMGRESNKPG
ncbi:MAG: hypothetical protein IPJ90_23140 [Anaerolineaceae bacterium]|nr:hypothetical protein [Anaerolineaceae bacterium]